MRNVINQIVIIYFILSSGKILCSSISDYTNLQDEGCKGTTEEQCISAKSNTEGMECCRIELYEYETIYYNCIAMYNTEEAYNALKNYKGTTITNVVCKTEETNAKDDIEKEESTNSNRAFFFKLNYILIYFFCLL